MRTARAVLVGALAALVPMTAHAESVRGYDMARVNSFRAAHHRAKLSVLRVLQRRARFWARHMAKTHHLADDVRGWRSCPAKHYAGNAGKGWDIEDIQYAFEHSPVHRSNLLDRSFRWLGLAVAHSDDGRLWVAQEFCG